LVSKLVAGNKNLASVTAALLMRNIDFFFLSGRVAVTQAIKNPPQTP